MKNIKAIHQFTPTVAFGDSVSNGLIFAQKLLLSMGFESKIFICDKTVDLKFAHEVFNIEQYQEDKDQLLLYHHSIGHGCHKKIMDFVDKKILVYHNITPAHFFKNEKYLQVACDKGREQLKTSVTSFIGSFADSHYSCEELRYYEYKNPVVLPLLMDFDKKDSTLINEDLVQKHCDTYNILFVGRIAQNKCQHQLIDVVFQLKQKSIKHIKLFIVGGISQQLYFLYLKNYVKNLGLSLHVIITEKVSDEDLNAYYKLADLYLSLSEHEGFGIPLIEALKYDIPVLAYNAGGVSTTVIEDGLLNSKAPSFVANKIIELQNNPYLRVKLLQKQKKHLNSFSNENMKNNFIDYLFSFGIKIPQKTQKQVKHTTSYQVEGPFDSFYSLAIVNKNIALALDSINVANVKLYSTEGAGDFNPNLKKLDTTIKDIANKKLDNIDITIRNLYPPRTNAMKGYHKIIGPYGWEESKFPQLYVDNFNTKLTMLFTMSSYVKKTLKDNGVSIPVQTTGIVVEDILHVNSQPFSFSLPNGFKLLHISSCFPRKGVDLLLNVFDELDQQGNISLIIKTFPNEHNQILNSLHVKSFTLSKNYEKDISLYTKGNKQLLLINKDIPQSNIKYLYENTNLLVAPSFGEGFGLPMAEAMLLDLPVLTTAFGGQTDFCTPQNSWLIDFDFAYAKTHMKLERSLWAVPKLSSLKHLILDISYLPKKELEEKTIQAKQFILDNYSSKKVAQNIQNAIKNYDTFEKTEQLALFSTYNSKCGIAQYSKYLISTFEKKVIIFANIVDDLPSNENKKQVIRCWDDGREVKDINSLKNQLIDHAITKLIIQYNFSFIPLFLLKELLVFCDGHHIQTHLFLHSTKDVIEKNYKDSFSSIASTLIKSTKIYVHTLEDINNLKDFGIYKNTFLFHHGINSDIKQIDSTIVNDIPIIATFGFLLPQKGIFELIDVAENLHVREIKVKLLLLTAIHPAKISSDLKIKLIKKIENSPIKEFITLNTNFLDEKEVISKLQQADKILFLYKNTQESSSAAIRMGLLAGKEVITTPSTIFDDVSSVVTQTKDDTIDVIADTLINSLKNKFDNTKLKNFIKENSWARISSNFYNSIR